MENKKWTKEEAEQNKNKLLQELQQEPFNTSGKNLELITKELNQLINEEEERQKIMEKSKQVELITTKIQEAFQVWETVGGDKETKQEYEIKQFPKMYHPTRDSISIPLFIDGQKIVVEIRTSNFPAEY